jgi:hypothetical protein
VISTKNAKMVMVKGHLLKVTSNKNKQLGHQSGFETMMV